MPSAKTKDFDGRTYFCEVFDDSFESKEAADMHADNLRRGYKFIGDVKVAKNPSTKMYEVWWAQK